MAMKKKARRSKGGTTVNFSGVESGGRKCPDGDYVAEVTAAEVEESSAGNPMISAKWKITKGKFAGVTLFDNLSLVPNALWKLKTCLEALGVDPQEDDVEASDYAEEMIGKEATVIVVNETYEGEQRPKITGYGSAEGEEEDSEEESDDAEEEEAPKKKKGKVKDDEDEDEEDSDDEDDDAESDEEDDDEEEEEKPAKKGAKKTSSKLKEGSRVKFTDDDDNLIKGQITSLDGDTATVEDKNGDEYEIGVEHLTAL